MPVCKPGAVGGLYAGFDGSIRAAAVFQPSKFTNAAGADQCHAMFSMLRTVPASADPVLTTQASATCWPYKTLYAINVADSKPVEFRGSSLEDLRAFPLTARREAGHQLDQVQNGREPDDWKPMNTVGRGAKEIRIRDEAGAFGVL